jgi:hypothetical protein
MVKVDFDPYHFLDERTIQNLRHISEDIRDDRDWVTLTFGHERVGKSTLAILCCAIIDQNFDTSRIVFPTAELRYAIQKSKPYQAIDQDEGAETWLSGDSNTKETRKMVRTMMQIGSKNLYFNINIPDAGMINRYMKSHRANCVMRVISRGKFAFYSARRAKGIKKDSQTKKVIWPKPNYIGYWSKPPKTSDFWMEYLRKAHDHKFGRHGENPKIVQEELKMERFYSQTVDLHDAAKMIGMKYATLTIWACNGVLQKRFHVKPILTVTGKRLLIKDIDIIRKKIYGKELDMMFKAE